MKLCGASLTTIIMFSHTSGTLNATDFDEHLVQNHIRERIEHGLNRAIVIGVVSAEEERFFSAGTFREGDTRRVNSRTVFEMGGSTELFTALLATVMVEEGQIGWDDPMTDYLPETVQVSDPKTDRINLRNLVFHDSGLPRFPTSPDGRLNPSPFKDYGPDELHQFLSTFNGENEPGKKHLRSSLGCALLGYLLERKSGQPYESLVKDRILTPLGMTNTSVSLNATQRYHQARGHNGETQVPPWDTGALPGGSGFRSTTRDLLRFVSAQLGLLETPLYTTIQRTHEQSPRHRSEGMGIGLGWMILKSGETRIHLTNGQTGGSFAFLGFNRAARIGVVVLSNSKYSVNEIGVYILDPGIATLTDSVPTIDVEKRDLVPLAGVYELNNGRKMLISFRADKIFAQVGARPRYRIVPTAPDRFYHYNMRATLEFMRDRKGAAREVRITSNNQTHTARRMKIR